MKRKGFKKLAGPVLLPQILALTGGCDLVFPLAEPVDDVPNAYTCRCRCETEVGGETKEWVRDFDVCTPADVDDLFADCGGRVRDVAMGIVDQCVASIDPDDCGCVPFLEQDFVVEECDEICTTEQLAADCSNMDTASSVPGVEPVCLVEGKPMGFALSGRSTCEIDGEITIDRLDDRPLTSTGGVVEFIGAPCPGESCEIGIFYRLGEAVYEFTHWAPDAGIERVVFDNIRPIGASVTPGLLNEFGDAVLSVATIASSSRGRRLEGPLEGELLPVRTAAVAGLNAEPLDVAVLWDTRECSLDGAVIGEAEGEETGVVVAMTGRLVNMPPTADAGEDHDVECTSPEGANVTLDATGSTDPDDNIQLVQWRRGGPAGDDIGQLEEVVHPLQALGTTKTYAVSVLDAFWQISQDSVAVSVVDTTPPQLACNAPATITPPDAPIAFTATAVDTCDAELAAPVIDGFDCYFITPSGRRIDKTESCVVEVEGDTIHIIDVGGIGTHIAWHAATSDASGNVGEAECEVEVIRP